MTPPSRSFHPPFPSFHPTVLSVCLFFLHFKNTKAQRMSASVPTCGRTKHTKQQHSNPVSHPSHSLYGCISFNTVKPGSGQNTKVIHENFTRQELWWRSGETEKAHLAMSHLREFPLFKLLWREIALFCWDSHKEIMSWLNVCIRLDWIHRGSQNEVHKNMLVNAFQFYTETQRCKIKVKVVFAIYQKRVHRHPSALS